MLDDLAHRYRRRVLEPYGLGVPFVYAALGLAVFVATAPGLASFGVQNAYAKLGIVILSTLGTGLLLAAGYDLRRVDLGVLKLIRERDGPNAPSNNYLDDEFGDLAGPTTAADGGAVVREARE